MNETEGEPVELQLELEKGELDTERESERGGGEADVKGEHHLPGGQQSSDSRLFASQTSNKAIKRTQMQPIAS